MSKLITVIVAAMFAAVSASAFAASHTGAKGDKMEKSAKKGESKKAAPKKKSEPKKKSDKMDKK